jgi:hypothetical protein
MQVLYIDGYTVKSYFSHFLLVFAVYSSKEELTT